MRSRIVASKYELKHKVGQGGMGMVWEATDTVLQRAVAIKLMSPEQFGAEQAAARFRREAMALAQLRNDHIVQVYDFGIDQDTPYIVMELLEGEDLEARLKREKKLEPHVVVELMRQAASGLIAAAGRDLVHRDLKPANLFLTTSDKGSMVLKLLDFGVAWMMPNSDSARLTSYEKLAGTPHYMSPEQIRGRPPSHLGDLWSLGVIAYRALTGELPFRSGNFGNLIVSICTDPFEAPTRLDSSLPASLDNFFERALNKDPQRRFQSISEFIEAFSRASVNTSTITILAVDDEPDMARLLKGRYRKQILNSTYRFLFAEDGDAALEQLRNNPDIDVVLSDINMPKMDGLALLERIPTLSKFTRAIMVTAYGDMKNLRRAMNAGAFDFVVKPIDFKDLDRTLQKALQTVNEHRTMASSDEENKILRKLTSSLVVQRLSRVGRSLALAPEKLDATVVKIRITQPVPGDENSARYIQSLNANYEVIIPEVQRYGGAVDSILATELVCVWIGQQHVDRALAACVAICRALHHLALLAGNESPYAHGIATGVATGRLLSSCVGSQVGNRFNYSMLGGAIEHAAELSALAKPGDILVSKAICLHELGAHRFMPVEAPEEFEPGSILKCVWEEQIGVDASLEHTIESHSLACDTRTMADNTELDDEPVCERFGESRG